MTEQERKELRASIYEGARQAVADRLLGGGTHGIWCDADNEREWRGPEVGRECQDILFELHETLLEKQRESEKS